MAVVEIKLSDVLVTYLRAIGSVEHLSLHSVIVRACEEYFEARATDEYASEIEERRRLTAGQRAFVHFVRHSLGRYAPAP